MSKSSEYLRFATAQGEIVFPLAHVQGSQPGPRVVITAGVHGCEYSSIAAAMELYQQLDPNQLRGSVDIVTIVNLPAFEQRTPFVCPIDGKNPNRVCPGSSQGSYSEVLVWRLLQEVIRGADYYLDLHGGDLVEKIDPFSIYHAGGDAAVMAKSRQMALCYGLPNMIATGDETDWPDHYTTYANAAKLGVPAIIAECGGIGQLEAADVATHMRGLENVLRFTASLPGEVRELGPCVEYHDFIWLYTPLAGFYQPSVSVGQEVEQEQPVGRITDYFGQERLTLKAPASGRVLFVTTSPAMTEQGLILAVGRR